MLSWPSWLTCCGRFTHISGHLSAAGRAQDRESSPVRDRRSTTVPRHQLQWQPISCYYYACDLSYFDVVLCPSSSQILATNAEISFSRKPRPPPQCSLASLGFPKSPLLKNPRSANALDQFPCNIIYHNFPLLLTFVIVYLYVISQNRSVHVIGDIDFMLYWLLLIGNCNSLANLLYWTFFLWLWFCCHALNLAFELLWAFERPLNNLSYPIVWCAVLLWSSVICFRRWFCIWFLLSGCWL